MNAQHDSCLVWRIEIYSTSTHPLALKYFATLSTSRLTELWRLSHRYLTNSPSGIASYKIPKDILCICLWNIAAGNP